MNLCLASGSLDSSKAIRKRKKKNQSCSPLTLMLKSLLKLNSIELHGLQEQAKINVLKLVSFLFVDQSQHGLLI